MRWKEPGPSRRVRLYTTRISQALLQQPELEDDEFECQECRYGDGGSERSAAAVGVVV
jgi:hypothetical protein